MTSNTASPVSAINHIALMTGELDRLADFYAAIFGAQILGRSEGTPRKCFLRLISRSSPCVTLDTAGGRHHRDRRTKARRRLVPSPPTES